MKQEVYAWLATAVLAAHLAWIVWVILGAFLTRRRRLLAGLHILSLVYSIVITIGPWPCPLTALEQYFQGRAGMTPYRQTFLLHYLEAAVYPDVPAWLLTGCALAICIFNLCVHACHLARSRRIIESRDL